MKIKILEYKVHKGNKVRVRSHNFRKGKWKINPNYEWHKKVSLGLYNVMYPTLWRKEYSIEVYDDKNQYKKKRKNETKNFK